MDSADIQVAHAAWQLIRPMLLEAGDLALALRSRPGNLELKADDTPVTVADREIEALLVEHFRREFPHDRILTEEGSASGNHSRFTWVIDPLDGTRAYISGLPIWGISIGLLHDDEPMAGAFYLPAVNELYWGNGQDAFLNEAPLTSPAVSLNSSFAFLAVPSNCHMAYEISFGRLRSLGSTAAHLIYVARGAAIGALTRRVRLWDLAGVLPILMPLGIELRYLSGAPFLVRDLMDGQRAPEPMLAAPKHLIDPLLTMIRPKSAGQ